MKIYEVVFCNGWQNEDREYEYFYYETLGEAEAKFASYKIEDYIDAWHEPYVVLNILELGTQKREKVRYQALYDEEVQTREREAQRALYERTGDILGIDALKELRRKLAGE